MAGRATPMVHGSATARSGCWSAPGRVNLIGEHTDYNGGLALPIAIPHRTYAALTLRDDTLLRIRSAQMSGSTSGWVEVALGDVSPSAPGGWAAYVAGVFWALKEAGHDVRGADVEIDGRVPLGAGLSSSAALTCAVAAGVSDLLGLGLLESTAGRRELIAACVRAENEIALAPTGGMDQVAAMLCREGEALLLDCRSGATEHVPFDPVAHGLSLLVTDTRAHHALNDGAYAARRTSCEEAAVLLGVGTLREIGPEGLAGALATLGAVDGGGPGSEVLQRRVHHVVSEIRRVEQCVDALGSGDFGVVGALWVESHDSLRDDFEVSCEELDVAVEVALACGAVGARMTGGGFGGSTIALVPTPRLAAVSAAIADAFGRRGWDPPRSFTVSASAPARREP